MVYGPDGEARGARILSKPLPLLLLCCLIALYLSHFRLPFTPIGVTAEPWEFFWDAGRMWEGERIYRDFFELTPPGIEVVALLFFQIFGLRNWIPHVHVILLGLSLSLLTLIISRKVIRGRRFLALLPGCLFLTFAFFPTMVESHRWFSSAAVLAGLAAVIEERTPRRVILAGMLSGVASFFTQTQGVFAVTGLAIFLFWEWRQRKSGRHKLFQTMTCLLASFLVTVVATYAYFIWKAGLDRVLDCLVRFPLLYYPADRVHNSWQVYLADMPQFPPWSHLPRLAVFIVIHAVVPLVYLLYLAHHPRVTRDAKEGARLMLLNIVGLCLFASILLSPSYFRLCTVSAPALVTFVYWIRRDGRLQRISAGLLWAAALCFLIAHPLRVQMSPVRVLQLPRGPIAFPERSFLPYALLRWLALQTQPGEFVFAGDAPGIFFPLALRPVGQTPGYDNTGFTRPEHVRSAVAALERQCVRLILWPPNSTDPRLYRPEEDHLEPLRKYVQMNYHLVKRFDSSGGGEFAEIWQRNE
jgi:hypothetical protein